MKATRNNLSREEAALTKAEEKLNRIIRDAIALATDIRNKAAALGEWGRMADAGYKQEMIKRAIGNED